MTKANTYITILCPFHMLNYTKGGNGELCEVKA